MQEVFHPSPFPMYIRAAIFAGLFTLLALFFSSFLGLYVFTIISIVWGIAFIFSFAAWLDTRFKRIEISETNLLLKAGVFSVKTILVPFTGITNVRVRQSFFDRVVGVGTVVIDTPGGSNTPEIEIQRIPARALETILEKTKTIRSQPH